MQNQDNNFLIYTLNLLMYLTLSLSERHLYVMSEIYFETRVKI